MGNFKKGILVGGLLGAAMMWLNTTKKGRKMRGEIIDHAAEVYEQVREKISASDAWQNLTESKYAGYVRDVLDTYVAKYHIPEQVRRMVEKIVNMQWKNVKKQTSKTTRKSAESK